MKCVNWFRPTSRNLSDGGNVFISVLTNLLGELLSPSNVASMTEALNVKGKLSFPPAYVGKNPVLSYMYFFSLILFYYSHRTMLVAKRVGVLFPTSNSL